MQTGQERALLHHGRWSMHARRLWSADAVILRELQSCQILWLQSSACLWSSASRVLQLQLNVITRSTEATTSPVAASNTGGADFCAGKTNLAAKKKLKKLPPVFIYSSAAVPLLQLQRPGGRFLCRQNEPCSEKKKKKKKKLPPVFIYCSR